MYLFLLFIIAIIKQTGHARDKRLFLKHEDWIEGIEYTRGV